MTYTMRLGLSEPGLLSDSFQDPRLREYRVLWADDEQREGLAYVPGSSTRGVNFKRLGDEVLIRLQTLASPADWLIGLRIAAVLAEGTGADLRLEAEGKRVPGDEILTRLDADWLAPRCHLGTELITELVLSEGQTVALQGWSDAFQIGPALLAELGIGPETDSEDAYVLLVKRMRRHQQLAVAEDVHRPTGMVLASKDADSDREFCCASLPLNLKIWVDTAFLDALALWPESWQQEGREPAWFPSKRLPELLIGHVERLDEQQYLVGPLSESEAQKLATALQRRLASPDLEADFRQVQALFVAKHADSSQDSGNAQGSGHV